MATRLAQLDDTPAEPLSEEALKALEGRLPQRVQPPTLDPFFSSTLPYAFRISHILEDSAVYLSCFRQLLT
jgi:hypothetical protein